MVTVPVEARAISASPSAQASSPIWMSRVAPSDWASCLRAGVGRTIFAFVLGTFS